LLSGIEIFILLFYFFSFELYFCGSSQKTLSNQREDKSGQDDLDRGDKVIYITCFVFA
jgi:hypothetical protein